MPERCVCLLPKLVLLSCLLQAFGWGLLELVHSQSPRRILHVVGVEGGYYCLWLVCSPPSSLFSLLPHQGLDELDRDAEELLQVQLTLHLDLLSRPWHPSAHHTSHGTRTGEQTRMRQDALRKKTQHHIQPREQTQRGLGAVRQRGPSFAYLGYARMYTEPQYPYHQTDERRTSVFHSSRGQELFSQMPYACRQQFPWVAVGSHMTSWENLEPMVTQVLLEPFRQRGIY